MARCPAGHESQTDDYCDTCGTVMVGAPVTGAPAGQGPAMSAGPAMSVGAAGEGEPGGEGGSCPQCAAERGGRFCEECGYDYELAQLLPPGPPPGPEPVLEPAEPAAEPTRARLVAVVTADREYYAAQVERGDIAREEFPFPRYPGQRRFVLDGEVLRIGRASAGRGIAVEIDLTGPPLDPAVSHLHAQLLRGPDGGWSVVDLGSANGTRLNGAEQPLPVETEFPVRAGDRIHVGVWTTLTLEEL